MGDQESKNPLRVSSTEQTIHRLQKTEARLSKIVSTQAEQLSKAHDQYEVMAKQSYRIEGERNALIEMVNKLLEIITGAKK